MKIRGDNFLHLQFDVNHPLDDWYPPIGGISPINPDPTSGNIGPAQNGTRHVTVSMIVEH